MRRHGHDRRRRHGGPPLGGGYGHLNERFGLAADNLLGAELVLADGSAVTADGDHEAGLFWALRGGGGNFGVVTSMRIRLHAAGPMLAGVVTYPLPQAAGVLGRLEEILAAAPDELTVVTAMLTGPDGVPAVSLVPLWCGDPASGEAHLERPRRLGTPSRTPRSASGGTTSWPWSSAGGRRRRRPAPRVGGRGRRRARRRCPAGRLPQQPRPSDTAQVAHAYGPNTARLLAANRHYDPDAVFSATPSPRSEKTRLTATAPG